MTAAPNLRATMLVCSGRRQLIRARDPRATRSDHRNDDGQKRRAARHNARRLDFAVGGHAVLIVAMSPPIKRLPMSACSGAVRVSSSGQEGYSGGKNSGQQRGRRRCGRDRARERKLVPAAANESSARHKMPVGRSATEVGRPAGGVRGLQ